MAREGEGRAVLRLAALLRSAHALRAARAVRVALPRAPLPRRDRLHRLADRPRDRRSSSATACSIETIVAVIGDHGESLEPARRGHARLLHLREHARACRSSSARRSSALRGRRVADPVRSVDLMPTVLDLLGIAPPTPIAGVSLAPLMTGARADAGPRGLRRGALPAPPLRLERPARVARRALQGDRRAAARAVRPRARPARDDEPLRRTADGGRRDDRAAARSSRRSAAGEAESQAAPEVDPEARARLAALGYVGSFVATASGREPTAPTRRTRSSCST